MNYIIFDLEATCKENDREFEKETIEIGAIKVNENLEVVSTFNEFIKPKLNSILTDFCTKLTSITQEDVDKADNFAVVLKRFKKWLSEDGEAYILCSWGFYDKSQFISDCRLHGIDTSWVANHISLKHQFALINGIRPCGMEKALRMLKIELEGTHHRGIDDAKNIGKIFIKTFGKWNIPHIINVGKFLN